jgi:hypothetical protein
MSEAELDEFHRNINMTFVIRYSDALHYDIFLPLCIVLSENKLACGNEEYRHLYTVCRQTTGLALNKSNA